MSITPHITLGHDTLFHVDSTGRVSAWGNNSERLCDIPADLPPVVQIVSSHDYAIALCQNGTVQSWGTGSKHVITTHTNLRHITTKFGITEDGQVVRLVPFQQLQIPVKTGPDTWRTELFADQLPTTFTKPVTRLWELNEHVYAVHADGTMTSWQELYANNGQHRRVPLPDDLTQLKAVTPHIKLYQDGHLEGWNDHRITSVIASIPHRDFVDMNEHFALRATGELVPMPTVDGQPNLLHNIPTGLTDVIQMNANTTNMVALTRDSRVAVWGENHQSVNPTLPVNDPSIVNMAATRGMVLIQYADGSVKIWDGEFHAYSDFIKPGQARIVQMAANIRLLHNDWYRQFIVLDNNGHVYTDDRRWELDFDSDSDVEPGTGHIIPAAVQGNTAAVFVDKHHVYAVQKDPTIVYAWGGHAARVFRTAKPVKQIVGDGDYTFFLYQDGTVSVDGPAKFQPPANLGTVKSIAASDTHILALLENGTVVAWGDNELGACDVPADLGPVVQVAVGDDFSVVLCADGSVRGWGENGEGQYAFAADLPKVRQISTSFYETYVLTESGSVIKSHRPSIFDVPAALRV